uniref:Uncharacterized protein n=1 Tax=Parascaris univalens TaxID=6257 RepID=A0A915A0P3_PARUN
MLSQLRSNGFLVYSQLTAIKIQVLVLYHSARRSVPHLIQRQILLWVQRLSNRITKSYPSFQRTSMNLWPISVIDVRLP